MTKSIGTRYEKPIKERSVTLQAKLQSLKKQLLHFLREPTVNAKPISLKPRQEEEEAFPDSALNSQNLPPCFSFNLFGFFCASPAVEDLLHRFVRIHHFFGKTQKLYLLDLDHIFIGMVKNKQSIWKMGFGVFVLMPPCLMQCFLVVHGILDPLDFLALQSIRKGLEDMPGSNFFASWDFTSEPCNFSGVYCESDKVVALTLGDQRAGSLGLTGRIDPAIGKLSSLAELSIVPGRISGFLPQSLSKLKNLRFLAVGRNFITGTIPAALGDMSSLKTLDLSYNRLSGEIPPSIGTLPELSNLILCHNLLSGPVPFFLSPTMTRLDVKQNNLSGSIRHGSLPPSLQFISLSRNRLSGSVDWLLNRLDQLNYLDLSFNQFAGTIPSKVFTFSITNLQLQRNRFSGSVQPTDQVTIPTVDLSYNRLSGPLSPMFSTVQNLFLNNNRFTGQVPSSFVDRLLSANIQTLYLHHNFLTRFEINPTAEIPLSISLCLQYNCMVPPVATPCPLKAGTQKTRPTDQCIEWKG